MHLFEPVPAFFKELEGIWDKYKTDLGFDATLYNQGLGSNDRFVRPLPECHCVSDHYQSAKVCQKVTIVS